MRKTKNPNQTKYVPPSNPDVAAKKFGFLLFIIVGTVAALFSVLALIPKTPNYSKPTIGTKVFMDIEIGTKKIGKMTFGLFDEIVPKTVENFKQLCISQKKRHGYKNSSFHRVMKQFMIQGGDYENNDGTGGSSIYGKTFPDENFHIKHFPGALSMANAGKDTNGAQFFITTVKTDWLDGKHVVFGRIIDGEKVLRTIESQRVDDKHKPFHDIRITKCGLVE
eukprot:gene4181-7491_t